MRQLTLLELLVEWDQIPHDKFLVVRVTQLSADKKLPTATYYYQRGCCGGPAYPERIGLHVRRSVDQFIDVLDGHPYDQDGRVQMSRCDGCARMLGEHFTMAQCDAIVDRALARNTDAHADAVRAAGPVGVDRA